MMEYSQIVLTSHDGICAWWKFDAWLGFKQQALEDGVLDMVGVALAAAASSNSLLVRHQSERTSALSVAVCLGRSRIQWSATRTGIRHRRLVAVSSWSDLLLRDRLVSRQAEEEEEEAKQEAEEDYEDDVEEKEEEEDMDFEEYGGNDEDEDAYLADVDSYAARELLEAIARLRNDQAIQAERLPKLIRGWMKAGNELNKQTLLYVMRKLKKRNRAVHALKIADWMALTKPMDVDANDAIFRIELAGLCGSVNKAKRIFQQLPLEHRSEGAYNALLLAHVKSKRINKAEEIFDKLRGSKMISSPYTFTLMASLYRKRGLEEKVLPLVEEAERLGIGLDIYFNNNLLAAKHKVEGIREAEKLYDRIISTGVKKHFMTYMTMAICYTSASLAEKAEGVLKEIEHGMETGQFAKQRRKYNALISMYASLKNARGMERAWKELVKLRDPPLVEDYYCMIKAWGKIGEVEGAERVFKEAEANDRDLKFSMIFNAMMYVYSVNQMADRAEALVRRMEDELCIPLDPWCYHNLIMLYSQKRDFEKMLSVLRAAQVAGKQGRRFRPLQGSLWVVLNSFAQVGDVGRAEQVFKSWKRAGYGVHVGLYNRLLKVYLSAEQPVEKFIERMLADNIRPNKETENLFDELKRRLIKIPENQS